MRTRMYGGVGGRKTKVGGNLLLFSSYPIFIRVLFCYTAITPELCTRHRYVIASPAGAWQSANN